MVSEYMERHTVSNWVLRLGTVTNEGGQLTEAVRPQPAFGTKLAHPDVFNMLLQILESTVDRCEGPHSGLQNTLLILTLILVPR